MSSAPSSFGVTLGRRISSAASWTGSTDAAFALMRRSSLGSPASGRHAGGTPAVPAPCRRSFAQQFVDRGAGAGLGVDLLDDDGAIEAGAWAAVRQRPAG